MSGLGVMGAATAVFSTVGAAIGGTIGGPVGALEGAKLGGALGVQTAVMAKGEEAIDAMGNRASLAADKTGKKMLELADKAATCLEKVAESWSTLFLIGYATSIAFQGSSMGAEQFEKFCSQGVLSNANCIPMYMTTLSFNMAAVATAGALAKHVYKLTLGNK